MRKNRYHRRKSPLSRKRLSLMKKKKRRRKKRVKMRSRQLKSNPQKRRYQRWLIAKRRRNRK